MSMIQCFTRRPDISSWAVFGLNRGKYNLWNEEFADLSQWVVTGDVTVSGGVCTINDINASSANLNHAINNNPWQLPIDRPFVVEAAISVASGQKCYFNVRWGTTTIASLCIGEEVNKIYISSQGTAGSLYTPTNFNQSVYSLVRILVNPVTGISKFFLYWKDTSTLMGRMEEVGTNKTWSYTKNSHPNSIYFSTGGAATGTVTIKDLRVYIPWGIIIGDSIATGHPFYDPIPSFYVNQYPQSSIGYWLTQACGGAAPVVNQGIGGQSTVDVAIRYQSMILPWQPDYAFFQVGTNDTIYPIADSQARLTTVIDACLSAGIKCIVNEMPPIDDYTEAKNSWKNEWNGWLPLFAATRPGCFITQIHDLVEDAGNPGHINPILTPDQCHYNVTGYRLIAEQMWRVLTGQPQL